MIRTTQPKNIKHLKINSVPNVWSVMRCGQRLPHIDHIFHALYKFRRDDPSILRRCDEFSVQPCACLIARGSRGSVYSSAASFIPRGVRLWLVHACSAHQHANTRTGGAFEIEQVGAAPCRRPVMYAAVLSFCSNWANDTHLHTHAIHKLQTPSPLELPVAVAQP